MPLNSQSIVLSLAWILMVIPLRAQEAETKHDVPTLEITGSLAIPDLAMPRAAQSPDGKRLVAPLRDDRLAVWNLASGERELVTKERHGWQIFGIAFSPDGQTIATASSDKTAKLWDATTGKLLATLKGHEDRLEYLSVSPKGKYLFTSTGKTWPYERYGSVEARIWNAKTGELVAKLHGHSHTITRAEFSDDETRVLTASDDHTARVWDTASGKQVHKFDLDSRIMTAIYNRDGKTILTSSRAHRNSYAVSAERQRPVQPPLPQSVVKLWNATNGKELLNLPHPPVAPDPGYGSLAEVRATFDKAGDQILTARRGLITYWDAATGKKLATLREASVPPPTVIFSPKSDFFVVINRERPAELWGVAEQEKVREMDVPFLSDFFSMEGLRYFSPDGKTFYSLHKGEFRWWSLHGIE